MICTVVPGTAAAETVVSIASRHLDAAVPAGGG
jgi:hypothetical protein